MKILHMADVHIDETKTVNGKIILNEHGINIRLCDLLDCLEQVKEIAKKEKVSLIIIAGDLYERKQPLDFEYYTASKLMSELTDIAPVVLIAGNHDSENAIEALSFINNVTVLKPFTPVRFEQVTLFGLPYPDLSEADALTLKKQLEEKTVQTTKFLRKSSNFLICVGHVSVEGASYPTTSQLSDVALSVKAFEGIDYVALGHIHKPQQIKNVYYPGSIDTWKRQEADQKKGFYIIDTDTAEVTFYTIKTRPVYNFKFYIDSIPEKIEVEDGAIVTIEVEVEDSRTSLYDRKKILEVLTGNPLDVKIIPKIIRTQRPRCEAIIEAKNFEQTLITYMQQKQIDQDSINRILSKVSQLAKEINIPYDFTN